MIPTKEQRAVISCDDPRMAVQACPGSGKTATMIELARRLSEEGHEIALITYTNEAADEITRRLRARDISAQASTIHGFCRRSLAIRPTMIETDFVYDVLAADAAAEIRPRINKSALKAARFDDFAKPILRQVWDQVHKQMNAQNVADHDWLLRRFVAAPQTTATVLILDEAQDSGPATWDVIEAATNPDEEIRKIVVGDENQAIFSFAGSSAERFQQFEQTATRFKLTTNFRSGMAIVSLCNKQMRTDSIARCDAGRGHTYVHRFELDEKEMAELMEWLGPIEAIAGDEAILVRTNKERERLSSRLQDRGFHTTDIETAFPKGWHASVAFLKWLARPSYLSLRHWGWKYNRPLPAHHEAWTKVRPINALEQALGVSDTPKEMRAILTGKEAKDLDLCMIAVEKAAGSFVERCEASLVVSTVHKAKGKEWPHVWLYGVDDRWSTLGGRTDREEERRILYVAMSRAMNSLTISSVGQPKNETNLIDMLTRT